jgi:hypothetical protein
MGSFVTSVTNAKNIAVFSQFLAAGGDGSKFSSIGEK